MTDKLLYKTSAKTCNGLDLIQYVYKLHTEFKTYFYMTGGVVLEVSITPNDNNTIVEFLVHKNEVTHIFDRCVVDTDPVTFINNIDVIGHKPYDNISYDYLSLVYGIKKDSIIAIHYDSNPNYDSYNCDVYKVFDGRMQNVTSKVLVNVEL